MFKRAWDTIVLHGYMMLHMAAIAAIIGVFILTVIAVIALPILFIWRLLH